MANGPQDPEPANPQSVETAGRVARGFFRMRTDPVLVQRDVRRWLMGIPTAVVLVPAIFWLRFGEVGPLGWGLTVFLVAYCVLAAAGLHFLVRPEYHTPVAAKHDWIDRVGGFWLLACALGPLAGWVLTQFATDANWQGLYWARVVLAVGLPALTALCLLRYVRGRGAPIMLATLIGVTALPVWSAWGTMQALLSS